MTLRALFEHHGITRPIDLAKRTGMSRQYAHLIWTGQRGLSRKKARLIADATGISYAELMGAELSKPAAPPPRGRPRTRP